MKRARRLPILVSVLAMTAFTRPDAFGVVVYSENFDVDHTANWTVNSGPGTNNADIFFDYSTVGIPSAPQSTGGSTRGLRLQANVGSGVFGGLSASPTGQSFSGTYTLRFDLWMNYNGPLNGGGNGSTQVTGAGFGTAGSIAVWQGAAAADSVFFAATGDGGSASDYRAYYPNTVAAGFALAGDASPVYAAAGAGNRNNSHPYYSGFGNVTAPAAQLALFPGQTGSTAVGTPAFGWHDVIINVTPTSASWTVDGTLLATLPLDANVGPLGGGNILFMQADINATSSTDPNAALLFGLVDNVQVDLIPEPAVTSLLAAMGALALRRRIRPGARPQPANS